MADLSPAEQYDAWYDIPLGAACLRAELDLLREAGAAAPGGVMLEIGCGTGRFLRELAEGARLAVGTDHDAQRLELARRNMPAHSPECCKWVLADNAHLPLADECCDVVFANTALCFAPDADAVIGEMVRVCRRGGRMIVGELNPYAPWQLWRRAATWLGRRDFQGATWRQPRELVRLLGEHGCDAEVVGRAIFSPPLKFLDRLGWRPAVENLGRRLWPWAGAYFVVAGSRSGG